MDDAKRLSDKLNTQRSDSSFYVQANLNSIEGVNRLAKEAQKITSELNVLVNHVFVAYDLVIVHVTLELHLQDDEFHVLIFDEAK